MCGSQQKSLRNLIWLSAWKMLYMNVILKTTFSVIHRFTWFTVKTQEGVYALYMHIIYVVFTITNNHPYILSSALNARRLQSTQPRALLLLYAATKQNAIYVLCYNNVWIYWIQNKKRYTCNIHTRYTHKQQTAQLHSSYVSYTYNLIDIQY